MDENRPGAGHQHGSSSRREYIAALTGLRGIAALLVFVYHYSALHPGIRLDQTIPVIGYWLQLPLGLGFAGVDLFFVLSGFLLSLPFARAALQHQPTPALSVYFQRRLLRVFPAYYAQWAIIALLGAWFVSWRALDVGEVLAHFLMFFNIGLDPVSPIVGLWWTLPVELSFYLLLPALVVFMQPGRWLWLLAAGALLSVAFRAWAASGFDEAGGAATFLTASQLPGSLPEFLLGASAALLSQHAELRGWRRPQARSLDALFITGAALAVLWMSQVVLTYGHLYWRGHWSMVIAPIALGSALSLMVLAVYWGSRVGRALLANRVVYFIGLISYSLYLWHFVIMQQIQKVGGQAYVDMPGYLKFLLCTVLVVALSALSYALFERPFFKLRGRRSATTA